jgi:hypothetical protein
MPLGLGYGCIPCSDHAQLEGERVEVSLNPTGTVSIDLDLFSSHNVDNHENNPVLGPMDEIVGKRLSELSVTLSNSFKIWFQDT